MPDLKHILLPLKQWGLCLILLIAFLVGMFPQDASNPVMLVPFALLAIYVLLSGRLSDLSLRDPVLLGLLLLWLGWTWGACFSPVAYASDVTLLILGILPVTYIACAGKNIIKPLYAVFGAITFLALYTCIQRLLPGTSSRIELFFEDANLLGALIAMMIPLSCVFALSAKDRKYKFIAYTACALLLCGLISTQSRSGLIACIPAITFILFKYRDRIPFHPVKAGTVIAAILLTLVIASGFFGRLVDAFNNDEAIASRLALWSSAARMLFIDPVHGVGLGIFHLFYPPYRLLEDNSAGYWVHMDPLQWAVETGWAIIPVFYALFAFVFFRCFKEKLTDIELGAGAGLLTIFLICHAGYFFHSVPVIILTGIFFSAFAPTEFIASRLRYIPAISLMIVLLCGLWSVMRIAPTLYFWTQATNDFRTQDAKSYVSHLQQCLSIKDKRFPDCKIEAARLMILNSPNPEEESLTWLLEAQQANPLSPEIGYLRAEYYSRQPSPSETLIRKELEQSLNLDPAYWPARRLLVRRLVAANNLNEAKSILLVSKNYYMNERQRAEIEQLEKVIAERLKK